MWKILVICLVWLPLFGDDAIVVRLETDGKLTPLYLNTFADDRGELPRGYLAQLEAVLRFDLDHNGRTHTVSKSREITQLINQEKGWKTFHASSWETLGIPYVVKVSVNDKKLSAAAFSLNGSKVHQMDAIPLSGYLAQDRQKIHQVADAIHRAFFNVNGICSTRVLYTLRKKSGSNAAQWVTEIWESDYDGANARQVTKEGHLCVTPTYLPNRGSPHARHFLYVSYRIGQPKIYLASLDEGEGKRLSYLRGNQLMPAISPQKNMIAFISDITGNPELFVQPFSPQKGLLDKPQQIFSAPSGAQGSPTFSYDGKQIAFVSNKDGTPRIYLMDIPHPGTSIKDIHPTIISKRNRNNTCPSWSPDGRKIAYSAMTSGVRQIWAYDLTSGEETQLTEGLTHKENPCWAPDGLHLIFNTSTNDTAELYLINLNQKDAIKISQGPGEKRFPSWEPAA